MTKRVLALALDRRGWDQTQFASQMGVEKAAVTNWKNPKRGFPFSQLPRAAEKIGCTVDELLTGTAPATNSAARTVTEWGITVTEAGFIFAAEWDKLDEPEKTQIHNLVHGLVGKIKRDELKKPIKGSAPLSTSRTEPKGPKSPTERPRRPN